MYIENQEEMFQAFLGFSRVFMKQSEIKEMNCTKPTKATPEQMHSIYNSSQSHLQSDQPLEPT